MALPSTMPANDLTVTATLELNKYYANFFADGKQVYQDYQPYTFPIQYPPTNPTKEGYIFKGWDVENATMPVGGITITAQFEEAVTIVAGTYLANETLTKVLSSITRGEIKAQDFDFVSKGVSYNRLIPISGNPPAIHYIIGDANSTNFYQPISLGVWTSEEDRIIVTSRDQQVSTVFAEYFNANFTKQPDTVTIEAGTYVANFTSGTTGYNNNITFDFSSNGLYYSGMLIEATTIFYVRDMTDLSGSMAYNFSGSADIMGWQNDAYKTVTLATAQDVSVEHGEWFNAKFTKQTVKTISFHVTGPENDDDFEAEEGMTWGEWVDSTYNTSLGITISGSNIVDSFGYPLHYNNTAVYTDSTIIDGASYTFSTSGGM